MAMDGQARLPLPPTAVHANVHTWFDDTVAWHVLIEPFTDTAGDRVCTEVEARHAIHEWLAEHDLPDVEDCEITVYPKHKPRPAWKREFDD